MLPVARARPASSGTVAEKVNVPAGICVNSKVPSAAVGTTDWPASEVCGMNESSVSLPAIGVVPSARTSRPRTLPLAPRVRLSVTVAPAVFMMLFTEAPRAADSATRRKAPPGILPKLNCPLASAMRVSVTPVKSALSIVSRTVAPGAEVVPSLCRTRPSTVPAAPSCRIALGCSPAALKVREICTARRVNPASRESARSV